MPTLPRRCDHVGSLLRPRHLAEARQRWRDGEQPADELAAIEDDTIRYVVNQQQRVGLAAITDGEFRRDWWHLDFLAGFEGIELGERPRPVGFSGTGANPPIAIVTGKMGPLDRDQGRVRPTPLARQPKPIDAAVGIRSAVCRTVR